MARTEEEKRAAQREANLRWRDMHKEQIRETAHKYRETHAEQIHNTQRAHYEANREAKLMSNRKWREAHPEQTRELAHKHYKAHEKTVNDAARKRNHHITPEEYEQRLLDQHGGCAICGGNRDKRRLCVDHDHATSAIRGLLCHKCNLALGHMDDRVDWLQKAIEYLQKS
jgi:hypothetical protein